MVATATRRVEPAAAIPAAQRARSAIAAIDRRRAEPSAAFAAYFADLAAGLPGDPTQRRAGLARFAALGFPTQKVEAWKYTNVARLVNRPLEPAQPVALSAEALRPHLLGGPEAARLVFVNGHLDEAASGLGALPEGVRIRTLAQALAAGALPTAADRGDERSLSHLNAAFMTAGAVIELAAGAVMPRPLQLLFVTVAQDAASMVHPRILIRMGDGSRLDVIESHVGQAPGGVLTNLVIDLDLADGVLLRHDRVQLQADGATLVSRVGGRMGAATRYVQTTASIGGVLVRNETELRLEGERGECLLNAAWLPNGSEQVDTAILLHHVAPNCHSDQFCKGVVDGRAHGVFMGKIFVHQTAQKTNAYQKNDNLLLSDDAEVDAKPELEIYADDVKCSHGATCGDLDPTALFYLRARGLDEATARSILTWSFLAEVIERFADAGVRETVSRAARARLRGLEDNEDLAGYAA